jgi:hypothetical protein
MKVKSKLIIEREQQSEKYQVPSEIHGELEEQEINRSFSRIGAVRWYLRNSRGKGFYRTDLREGSTK